MNDERIARSAAGDGERNRAHELAQVAATGAGIALAARRPGTVDVGTRADADVPFEAGGDLPFADRSVPTLWLGDAAAALPMRDQLQLMVQCRRALVPGGQLLLAESGAAATFDVLARWAALAGLVALPAPSFGWTKHGLDANPEPLVSILIISFNPRYFLECLDSAIAQSYRNIEIIICDDSRDDAISAMAASRASQADIRHVKNPERLRTRKNYIKSFSLARGEYIKFLNDDDLLAPDCVRTLLGAFLRFPDVTLATSHRLRIDAESRVIADMPATRPAVAGDRLIDGISLANAVIMHGLNFIGEPSTALFRKRDLDPRLAPDEPPFQFNGEEVRGAMDYAVWSRLLVQGNAAFFQERLSRFRAHPEQSGGKPDVIARGIRGVRALQRQWIALGLFRRYPPQLLRCQTLPPEGAPVDGWRLEPVLSLPQSHLPPQEALRAWRAVERHAFDPG